jgi:hypothetical protein
MWEFETIRGIAIEKLGSFAMKPVSKIGFCAKHGIKREWAREAFVVLAKRHDPINAKEMAMMGFEHAAIVAAAREAYIRLLKAETLPNFYALENMDPQEDSVFIKCIVKDILSSR